MRWTSRLFATICLTILCVPGCSPTVGHVRERAVDVDAGGHQLHLLIVGEKGPTVILESGLGGGVGWEQVRSQVGRFARVVTYDRAGVGLSEPDPRPRTARQIAGELRTALRNANLPPPFVLVGHSMGGPYVRVFAAMYPDEVAGMILVDPTQVNVYEPMEAMESWFAVRHPKDWLTVDKYCRQAPDALRDLRWMRGLEAKRMEEYLETVPFPQQDALRREWLAQLSATPVCLSSASTSSSVGDEFEAATESFRQALAAAPLPAVPIVLLAAPGRTSLQIGGGLKPELRAIRRTAERWHLEDYRQWVERTPGAKLVVARNCGHNIQHDNPELVVEAIRQIVVSSTQPHP
ncbi:MAG TPA: alpha/beta hydrolase [Pirellulales bacterium]|nr:alpha/beta hydrolase [Pirellulales bacterium]